MRIVEVFFLFAAASLFYLICVAIQKTVILGGAQ